VRAALRVLAWCAALAVITYGVVFWLAPATVEVDAAGEAAPVAPVERGEAVPPGASGSSASLAVRENNAPDTPAAGIAPQEEAPAEPDYSAQILSEDLPPEVLSLIQAAFVEFYRGNIEYAAMLAQEALQASGDYPAVRLMLYGMIGQSYESLGYNDLAIEHYRQALALYPLQRTSYDGMRRLDPAFAAANPELPLPGASTNNSNIEATSDGENP